MVCVTVRSVEKQTEISEGSCAEPKSGQTVARLTFENRGSEEIVIACSFTKGSKVSDVANNQGHDTNVSENPQLENNENSFSFS